jgi:hypothetical protein
MASAALMVSISALAASISALMPVWIVWGMGFSLDILAPSLRDGPKDQTSDAQLRIGEPRDSPMRKCAS